MGIDGTGQRIAVVGRSDINPSDMAQFRSTFGLPPGTIEQHLIGPDPGVNNAAGEAGLDLEWSGAIAPNATIVYVYANNVNDAVQAAVDQNLALVISESFGTCESQSAVGNRAMAQQANAQGITYIASAGDSGPAGCDPHGFFGSISGGAASGGLAVGIPASFPEVTAIGGTQFNENGGNYWNSTSDGNGGSAISYIPEMVWNQTGPPGLLAGAGGASIYFPKPAWQVAPGVPDDNARDIPDISFSASGFPHDPYIVFENGRQSSSGGTSAGAPSFAGVVALLNQYLLSKGLLAQPGLGNINPELYRLARSTTNVFHDITEGNNVVPCIVGSPDCLTGSYGYNAGPGYDLATGLGSVDIYNLVMSWSAPANNTATTLTASPGTIALGGTVQLTATVSALSSLNQSPPTGTITFTAGRTILGTTQLVNSGAVASATLTITEPRLPVGNVIVTATYGGDANFNSSNGTVTVAVAEQSAGSAVVLSITPNPAHEGQVIKVTLTELAGVATTITGWTINGVDDFNRFADDFGSVNLPAFGTLSSTLITATGVAVPTNRVYIFTGIDANGRQWSQQYTLTLVGPLSTAEMVLVGTPAVVVEDPGANPFCQWPQELLLREQNGLSVQLTRFLAGNIDMTSQIQHLFGTTQLAPFGTVRARMCQADNSLPAPITYEMDGIDQTGDPVTAKFTTTFSGSSSQ